MPACPECKSKHPDGTEVCPVDGATLVPDAVMAAQAKHEIAPGTVIGEYRVEEKIGEGGFGSVYRAVHPVIGKAVAIKLLSHVYSDNPQVVSRFISEARAVNQIRHKNIVDIFSFGALPDGRQYFIMELLVGKPLDKLLGEREHLSLAETVPLMRGVLKALAAAHGAGLVHRDLKPENVFLCVDDEGVVTPKLIDFGIAKLLGDDTVEHRTRTGTPMGTPYYMSPEQCRGRNVDHRADLYSIGAMLHVLLTGKKPFVGDSAMDLLYKQMTEAPPRLSVHREGLPQDLEELVLSLLAKDPKDRPQSALETSKRLEEILASESADRTLPMPLGAQVQAKKVSPTPTPAQTEPGVSGKTAEPVETRLEGGAAPRRGSFGLWPIAIGLGVVGAGAALFFATREDGPAPVPASSVVLTATSSALESAASERPIVTPTPPSASAPAEPVASSSGSAVAPLARSAAPRTSALAPSSASGKPRPAATFNPNDVTFDD